MKYPSVKQIAAFIEAYDQLQKSTNDQKLIKATLISYLPNFDMIIVHLLLRNLEKPVLKDLTKKFGLISRHKMGKVHLNGEFSLYIEVNYEKYFFMNCEIAETSSIYVHNHREISKERFETVNLKLIK